MVASHQVSARGADFRPDLLARTTPTAHAGYREEIPRNFLAGLLPPRARCGTAHAKLLKTPALLLGACLFFPGPASNSAHVGRMLGKSDLGHSKIRPTISPNSARFWAAAVNFGPNLARLFEVPLQSWPPLQRWPPAPYHSPSSAQPAAAPSRLQRPNPRAHHRRPPSRNGRRQRRARAPPGGRPQPGAPHPRRRPQLRHDVEDEVTNNNNRKGQ